MNPKIEDLCKIAILLITDGYLQEKTTWRVGFYSKSPELIKAFKDSLKSAFGLTPNIRKIRDDILVAEKKSKKFKILADMFKSFSTIDGKEINLEPFQKLPTESIREILRLAFSTEGCISPSITDNRVKEIRIILTSNSNELRNFIKDELKRFGIESNSYQNDVVIRRFESVENFSKFIGFLKGVKIYKSKKWKCWEKHKLLTKMIKLYKSCRSHKAAIISK